MDKIKTYKNTIITLSMITMLSITSCNVSKRPLYTRSVHKKHSYAIKQYKPKISYEGSTFKLKLGKNKHSYFKNKKTGYFKNKKTNPKFEL